MQTHYQHGPQIVERFMARGPSAAVYPGLWTGCELATLAQTWGGEQARDFSGRNNHGTLTGGPPWGYGVYRGGAFRAVTFDKTDDYVSFPLTALDPLGSTIAFWFNVNAIDGGSTGTGMFCGNSGSGNAYVRLLNATTIRFQTETTSTILDYTIPTVSINQWYHVALVRKNDVAHVYLNGIESTTGGQGRTQTMRLDQLGRYANGASGFWYDGKEADVRIYSRALSPAEIRLFTHPLAAYETRINRYWMFTSGGVAPAPEWVAIPRYGLAAAGLPKYALPRAGVPVAPGVNTWLYARRQSQIIGGGIA